MTVGRRGVEAARTRAPAAARAGHDAGTAPPRRRATPLAALRLAREQLRRGWPLLLVTALGLLVAVAVACTAPLFGALVADAQLRVAVDANGPPGRNVEVDISTPGISPDDLRRQDAAVRSLAGPALAGFAGAQTTTFIQVTPLRLLRVDARPVNLRGSDILQVGFLAYDYARAGPHMRLLAGRLPEAAPGQPPEAVVTAQMATQRGIHIGDTLMTSAPLPDGTTAPIAVRVVGIWQPLRPDEDFWNGRSFVSVPVGQDIQTWTYPVLLAPTDLAAALAPFPRIGVDEGWIYYTDTARITGASAGAVVAQVQRLRLRLSLDPSVFVGQQSTVRLFTGLDTAIPAAQRQLALLAQPLAMLALLVVGLALLFVAALAGLLAEAQAPEIAMLRSRGASAAQVLGGYALLGVASAAVAGLAGPPAGAWLAAMVLRRFAGVAAGAPAPDADVPGRVAAVAALAAALGAGAVVAATWQAARRDVVAWRRAEGRATRRPFWQRFYLDLALAALCVAGYVDLATFGGLGARERLGQVGGSPLLAAVPALLVLAAALVALRAFSPIARLAAHLAARGRGAAGMLALTQVGRGAAGPARTALLLLTGVGIGLFALGFRASLVANGTAHVAYAVGADLRAELASPLTGNDETRTQQGLAALAGVDGVTPVYRGDAVTLPDQGANVVSLLAVDPATWPAVAGRTSWQAGDAAQPLSALMGTLAAHPVRTDDGGTAGDAGHPIWALVSDALATDLDVRVGQRFALVLDAGGGDSTQFVAGAVFHTFPTLYPTQAPGGSIVVSLADAAALPASPPIGADEFWLRTSPAPAARAALAAALAHEGTDLQVVASLDRRRLLAAATTSPPVAGMEGLLTLTAWLAPALALLGALAQALVAARRRALRLALLQVLGMNGRQRARMLLVEQLVVYAFGVVGGTVLGLGLLLATLPYLQFGDAATDPSTIGVPPYAPALDPTSLAWFYAALVATLLLGLALAARGRPGSVARLGED